MEKLRQYLISAVVLLILDTIYLKTIQDIFAGMVVSIQRVVMKVKLLPSILCCIFIGYYYLRCIR